MDALFFARLSPLGSGSDYTVFLDHLGIPSFDFRFSGGYGLYHSVYDNFRWMATYGDPEFLYHAAAAKLWGLMAMRLANADIVPLRYATYARDLQVDLDNLRRDAIRRARTPVAPGSQGEAAHYAGLRGDSGCAGGAPRCRRVRRSGGRCRDEER